MQKRYYLDTCIWRDYFENRSDKYRPLGEWAFKLLKLATEQRINIVYSKIVINELYQKYTNQEISNIFEIIEPLLIKVKITPENLKEMKLISKRRSLPKHDVLHAILARNSNALLITRDKHFEQLSDICIFKKPEELI